eukprot:TRINITY_DN60627_c0_g1_i1.p1 TRINITY_DN60627_c0_g1~~TRINITY_DN60627_c0_g1_i1.p1  ORF type:complete len:735 (+),score=59.89 TRINITY_DN60627_c0_g1_i1:165-2207(+)
MMTQDGARHKLDGILTNWLKTSPPTNTKTEVEDLHRALKTGDEKEFVRVASPLQTSWGAELQRHPQHSHTTFSLGKDMLDNRNNMRQALVIMMYLSHEYADNIARQMQKQKMADEAAQHMAEMEGQRKAPKQQTEAEFVHPPRRGIVGDWNANGHEETPEMEEPPVPIPIPDGEEGICPKGYYCPFLETYVAQCCPTCGWYRIDNTEECKCERGSVFDEISDRPELSVVSLLIQLTMTWEDLPCGHSTLFLPTNDHLYTEPSAHHLPGLLKPENREFLRDVLLYNMVTVRLFKRDLPESNDKWNIPVGPSLDTELGVRLYPEGPIDNPYRLFLWTEDWRTQPWDCQYHLIGGYEMTNRDAGPMQLPVRTNVAYLNETFPGRDGSRVWTTSGFVYPPVLWGYSTLCPPGLDCVAGPLSNVVGFQRLPQVNRNLIENQIDTITPWMVADGGGCQASSTAHGPPLNTIEDSSRKWSCEEAFNPSWFTDAQLAFDSDSAIPEYDLIGWVAHHQGGGAWIEMNFPIPTLVTGLRWYPHPGIKWQNQVRYISITADNNEIPGIHYMDDNGFFPCGFNEYCPQTWVFDIPRLVQYRLRITVEDELACVEAAALKIELFGFWGIHAPQWCDIEARPAVERCAGLADWRTEHGTVTCNTCDLDGALEVAGPKCACLAAVMPYGGAPEEF